MNKTIINIAIFASLAALANASELQNIPTDSSPINEVCFGSAIRTINQLGHSITESEPFSSNIQLSIPRTCLLIQAGQKASTLPVDWVESGMLSAGNEWVGGNAIHTGDMVVDSLPGDLNFAINLNIIFENSYVCNNIFIGEGKDGMSHINWWLFSNNDEKDQTITCTDPNGNLVFAKVRAKDINTFDIYF